MSCGKDLLTAFESVGCTLSEITDGGSLDWYFDDNPELQIFLNKLCSCIKSGLLHIPESKTKQNEEQTQASLASLLAPDTTKYSDIKEKITETSLNICYKKDYLELLKQNLHLLEKQRRKVQERNASLKNISSQETSEMKYLQQQLPPIASQISKLLGGLLVAEDKLLSILSNHAEVEKSNKSTDSSASNSSVVFNRLEPYLHREEIFLKHLEDFADFTKLVPKEKLEPEVDVLLQRWQNDHIRLIRSFSVSLNSYNVLRGMESSLLLQIAYLKEVPAETPRDIIFSIEADVRKCTRLEDSFSECLRNAEVECEELAIKAMSSLVLTNYKIKLQRVMQFIEDQKKVLHYLRGQLCRWNLVQLIQKLEAKRAKELLLSCHNIDAFANKLQNSPQQWIESLEKLRKSQEMQLTETVPADDKAMETVAEVLDVGKEDLICTFSSMVESAKLLSFKVDSDAKKIIEARAEISDKLEKLQLICDVLNAIQSPLTPDTEFHGNLHLQNAVARLKTTSDLFFRNLTQVQNDFHKYQKNLEMCPREVFERNQRMKSVFNNCGLQT